MTDAGFVYLDRAFVERAAARVSLFERGFLFGDGLFETLRTYRRRVFRLERHLERLAQGLDVLRIPLPLSHAEIASAIERLLDLNGLQDAALRLMVWRGEGGGVDPADSVVPRLAVVARPPAPYPPALSERGMKGALVSIRQNEWSPLARLKSLNFLPGILGRMEARAKGADEAILLNTRGRLAEGAVSNVFLVAGGRLLTPSLDCGVLPGVTRAAILELAREMGRGVTEREVEPAELQAADEAFLTNTLMEVMPLTSLDGAPIGAGRPGPLTGFFARAYRSLVAKETGGFDFE